MSYDLEQFVNMSTIVNMITICSFLSTQLQTYAKFSQSVWNGLKCLKRPSRSQVNGDGTV